MLGERLYPKVAKLVPEMAGKVTGIMLGMDNSELFVLLRSEDQLRAKFDDVACMLQERRA